MKALVKAAKGIGNVEVRDVPEPAPEKPDDVKIEVKAASICGTDIHIYYDEYVNCPPVVLGHEMSGVVVEVGSGVTRFKVGDRVTSETFKFTCGRCRFCQAGLIGLCPERRSMGVHVDGAFTQYLLQREESLHKLPANIDFTAGSICEPLAAAVRAVYERATIAPGDVVLVSGPGPIGLLCLQAAKLQDATVVLCGTAEDKKRLQLGKSLGADFALDVTTTDPVDMIRELSNGFGADVAFECAGVRASLDQCVRAARKGAQLVLVGLFGHPVEMNVDQAVIKEFTVLPSFGYEHRTWRRAIQLLAAGKLKTEPLVSGSFPITEWEMAFEAVKGKQGNKFQLIPVS
jgi:L-iditol 2-dehydrogenase